MCGLEGQYLGRISSLVVEWVLSHAFAKTLRKITWTSHVQQQPLVHWQSKDTIKYGISPDIFRTAVVIDVNGGVL